MKGYGSQGEGTIKEVTIGSMVFSCDIRGSTDRDPCNSECVFRPDATLDMYTTEDLSHDGATIVSPLSSHRQVVFSIWSRFYMKRKILGISTS